MGTVDERMRSPHRDGASFLDQKCREVADEVVFVRVEIINAGPRR
jgi:hypothetical protein